MPTFHKPCCLLRQGEEQSDTEQFFRAFYITLFVGVIGGKKRIMGGDGEGGEMEEIDRSSITGRMIFHILFIYVVAIISI